MKIAVEGCCHGELDKIYETLAYLEKKEDIKVDLLLCCGDFQAVRNRSDLPSMAVPKKYMCLNTFWKYYNGQKKAPVLTIFIGGNHEASNYLQELPYGGWVAPNIYYLGYAGVIDCGGIRIGGLSGIYKNRDYNKGHFEIPPYNEETKRSVYHIRNLEVFRLKQIRKPLDIFISHDWPRGIYDYGNKDALLRKKKYFTEEVNSGILGSPPAEELLHELKPAHWFSAHLHVKFAALVQHQLPDGSSKTTKFLALDKCLPRRQFLQVLDIPHDEKKKIELSLDAEWLCILKSTNHLLNLSRTNCYMPGPGCKERYEFTPSEEEIKNLVADFGGNLTIPENFEETAPAIKSDSGGKHEKPGLMIPYVNQQTTLLCQMLDITDPNAVLSGKMNQLSLDASITSNPDEINLDEDEDDDEGDVPNEPDEDYTFLESSIDNLDSSVASPNVSLSASEIRFDEKVSHRETDSPRSKFEERFSNEDLDLPRSNFSTPLSLDKPVGLKEVDLSLEEEEGDTGLESGSQGGTGDSDTQSVRSNSELSGVVTQLFYKSADESALESSASELDSSKTDTDVSLPKAKKFKRRNASIYTSNEED